MTAYNVLNAASLTAGQPEDISVVLANLQAIASVMNGSLDNTNLSPSAAIAASKLAGYPNDPLKALRGDGTWLGVGYGISLPSTPVDGQEYVLVDSLSAPTYSWYFRYNAAKASNKWDFIGGSPLMAQALAAATASITVSTWMNPYTDPSITIPIAGDYYVEGGASFYPVSNAASVWLGLAIAGVNPTLDGAMSSAGYAAVAQARQHLQPSARVACAAGNTVALRYQQNGATQSVLRWGAYVRATPYAVGG